MITDLLDTGKHNLQVRYNENKIPFVNTLTIVECKSYEDACNVLSEEAGRLLRDGLQSNTMLTHLDLRLNQVSVDTAAAVDEICKTNKSDAQRTRRAMFEAQRAAVYGM